MLVLTVTGMYKELRSGHKVPPIRYFFRTLVIVPAGSGFCILNEELHVSNATDNMAKVKSFAFLNKIKNNAFIFFKYSWRLKRQ